MKAIISALVLGGALAFSGCSHMPAMQDHSAAIAEAVATPSRPEYFTKRDKWRQPQQVLAFSGIGPGDHVADLGAGGGYFSELLSLLVGPDGSVILQNPPAWVKKYSKGMLPPLKQNLDMHANITRKDAPFDDLGLAPNSLDAVTMMLIYHDVAILPADRAKMNREIYHALKKGGVLLITDHHAPDGSGVRDVSTLHRIDADMLRKEVEAAGFKMVAASGMFANPQDDRTLRIFDKKIRYHTDRFVYLFKK